MKKIFLVIITLIVLCLLITSCGGNGSSESSSSEEAKNTETEKHRLNGELSPGAAFPVRPGPQKNPGTIS